MEDIKHLSELDIEEVKKCESYKPKCEPITDIDQELNRLHLTQHVFTESLMTANEMMTGPSITHALEKKVECLADKGICSHSKYTSHAKLHVIAVISNPVRFARRYQLFNEFCERMKREPRVSLLTVELQQGNRPFATNATLKYRTKHEIWYKENLINLGVQHLPSDWQYMAWIDADIEFVNKNWAKETIEQLQTYDVVQLFSHATDLGPNGETLQVHTGYMYLYVNGECYTPGYNNKYPHPGYAHACTRKAFNAMGGLLDFAIFGSADYHMCAGLTGKMERTLHKHINKNYREDCLIFQERCERHIKRNVGYVQGTIYHYFHSCKSRRQYGSRPEALANHKFDPRRDLKRNDQGLWQLEDRNIDLRDEIRRYFRTRLEDSIDLFQDYQFTKQKYV
jgi:hypothetical protein